MQAAKERHAHQWKPPDAGSQAEQEYKLDFEKHSGKSIQEVLAKDPKYFTPQQLQKFGAEGKGGR